MSTTSNSTPAASTICIVGAKGQLGFELLRGLSAHPAAVHGLDVDQVDITRPDSIAATMQRLRPTLLINAAAYTDVDGCQGKPELAYAVNGTGPGLLAAACREHGCRLLHVSTDYVFDGTKTTPYLPDDPVNPQSVYGKSKAEGEQRIRESLADHVIVRTSWLFGVHGHNFVKTILRLAGQRDFLAVVTDQVGRPTGARDLAAALLALAGTPFCGTCHFANAGTCTWNRFAAEIVRLAGLTTPVRPMTTAELNRPAPRPAWSVLDTTSFTEKTGIQPRPWQVALAECVAELLMR